jgi:hypothetical protein
MIEVFRDFPQYLQQISTHGKVKVKSLCLTKYHAMKMYWGVEIELYAFLMSTIDRGE